MNPHDQLMSDLRPDLLLCRDDEKRGREFIAICIFLLTGVLIIVGGWMAGLDWWLIVRASWQVVKNYASALWHPLPWLFTIAALLLARWYARREKRKFSPWEERDASAR